MVSSVSLGGFSFLAGQPGSARTTSVTPTPPVRSDSATGTDRAATTQSGEGAEGRSRVSVSQRREADTQLGELASRLANSRLNQSVDSFRQADTAASQAPQDAALRSARTTQRETLQQRGTDLIGVGNAASVLNGTQPLASGGATQDATQARQQLLEFVRANGSRDEIQQAEALFRGDTRTATTQGQGTNGRATSTNATPANATPANATPGNTTANATAANDPLARDRDALRTLTAINAGLRQDQTAAATASAGETLSAEREALGRLTELNSSLRQGQAFGNGSRGTVLNFFA